MAKKAELDFRVKEALRLTPTYTRLSLVALDSDFDFYSIQPGQFVQVRIDDCKETFLRRPISINNVDPEARELELLVRDAGDGTHWLCNLCEGKVLNLLLPLGNGFDYAASGARPLLVGGGVGVAPLLYLGKILKQQGVEPTFLLAAKTAADLLLVEEFKKVGNVRISTDDGSAGAPGLVTFNPALEENWTRIYVCGPKPMMVGIAKIAHERGVECEVSLENTMACGLGACLCCVEDTKEHGNVCVCTDGPVFNAQDLKWFD